jgi:hypothetical protein
MHIERARTGEATARARARARRSAEKNGNPCEAMGLLCHFDSRDHSLQNDIKTNAPSTHIPAGRVSRGVANPVEFESCVVDTRFVVVTRMNYINLNIEGVRGVQQQQKLQDNYRISWRTPIRSYYPRLSSNQYYAPPFRRALAIQ